MINPTPEQHIAPEQFLFDADRSRIRCVDERPATVLSNGIAVPGGVYGIIDAIKTLKHVDEDHAWNIARASGIPIGGHIDEHHGATGCGYGRLVETQPATVLAPEAVLAKDRKEYIEHTLNGEILTLLGDHHPTEAVINYRAGTSIDAKQATEQGRGIFDFDIWAMDGFAQKLGLDGKPFSDHMLDVYKKTVTTLTGITTFTDIR